MNCRFIILSQWKIIIITTLKATIVDPGEINRVAIRIMKKGSYATNGTVNSYIHQPQTFLSSRIQVNLPLIKEASVTTICIFMVIIYNKLSFLSTRKTGYSKPEFCLKKKFLSQIVTSN